uniref:Ladderlectin-like n=1 Tax=Fundulus heteroclitus TaxID=8078 RepID=A0A3Q2TCF9_FUNHE
GVITFDLVQRSSCPPGWSPINNRCFLYVPIRMSWARAERNCLSMGAHLASVHDLDEYHQVQSLITTATYKSGRTWIGGTNAQETSIWFWSDGSHLHYTNWCDGEPNNAEGRQHCLQMNYSDEKCWDDDTCSVRLPSVCAKKV